MGKGKPKVRIASPREIGVKHLYARRDRYVVKIAVPRDLRAQFKSPHVEVYLRTSDRAVALQRYSDALAEITRHFQRARSQRPLTPAEIEAEGSRELRNLLAWMKQHPSEAENSLFGQAVAIENPDPDGEGLDYDALRPRALAIAERLHASPTDETIKALSEALAGAVFNAEVYWRNRLPAPALSREPSFRPSISISEAAKQFIAERQRDPTAKLTEQTAVQLRATFRLFASYGDDKPLSDVTRQDAAGYLTTISGLNPDYGRHPGTADLSLRELLAKFPAADSHGLSNRTLNRHQSALKTLFAWALKTGIVAEDRVNPFAGLARPKAPLSAITWQPYTIKELKALFDGLSFDTAPKKHTLATALPWIMAIALYGGMRQGEIADLDAEDLKREEGVDYFDVTAAKSEAGIRRVPVHSALVKLGLLRYAKSIGKGPLFPGLTPGGPDKKRAHTVAKRFPEFRRARNATRERLSFHSFRKCFVRGLELAKVDRDRAALVVGHERGFTYRVYNPAGLDMRALRDVVELVRYEGLKLPA